MNRPVALNLELVVTIVDKGVGDDVIEFSKVAGANGGTIIHGKGSGAHDNHKFLGIQIEPEKDVVLTLVPDSLTNAVMNAIGKGIEIGKPGNGICFSVDLDKVIGISSINSYRDVISMEELLADDQPYGE